MKHLKDSEEVIGAGIDLVMCILAVIICLLAFVVREKLQAVGRANAAEAKIKPVIPPVDLKESESQILLKLLAEKLGINRPVASGDLANLPTLEQILDLKQKLEALTRKHTEQEARQASGVDQLIAAMAKLKQVEQLLRNAEKRITALDSQVAGLESELKSVREELKQTLEKKRALELRLAVLQRPFVKEYNDTGNKFFQSGSATLLPPLMEELDKVIGDIRLRIANVDDRNMVDTIEVVGHTDGSEIGRNGNIDRNLVAAIAADELSGLQPGSNGDLALLRAMAAVDYIQRHSEFKRLGIKFRALSAGPTILPSRPNEVGWDGFLKKDDHRRRVEIRLLKTTSQGLYESVETLRYVDRYEQDQRR